MTYKEFNKKWKKIFKDKSYKRPSGLMSLNIGEQTELFDDIEQTITNSSNTTHQVSTNKWIHGYACAVAVALKEEGINTTLTDSLFRSCIGSIQKAIDAGVDESDIEEFKKYYQ